jgi:hypothetical protein
MENDYGKRRRERALSHVTNHPYRDMRFPRRDFIGIQKTTLYEYDEHDSVLFLYNWSISYYGWLYTGLLVVLAKCL